MSAAVDLAIATHLCSFVVMFEDSGSWTGKRLR